MLEYRGLSILSIVLLLLVNHTSLADSGNDLMQQGTEFAQQSQYEQALKSWQQAIHAYHSGGQTTGVARAWYRTGMLQFEKAQQAKALHAFKQAQSILSKQPNKALQSAVTAAMGSLYLYIGDLQQAEPLLNNALALSQELGLSGQTAAILNDLGTLAMHRTQYPGAVKRYLQALSFKPVNNSQTLLQVRINSHAIIAAQLAGQTKQLNNLKKVLHAHLKQLTNDPAQTSLLLQAGTTYAWLSMQRNQTRQADAKRAVTLLHQANKRAKLHQQVRLQSSALGELAYLYHQSKRNRDALHLIQQALFLAQSVQAKTLIGKWQWLAGRIYTQQHKLDQAITAYQQAIKHIPTDLNNSHLSPQPGVMFSTDNIHIEYAKLLLQQHSKTKSLSAQRKLLYAVRDSIEALKANELQDYFQDNCVAATRTAIKKLEQTLLKDTAVLYPIVFDDRIELLLSHQQGIERFTSKINRQDVRKIVRKFRTTLEKRRTRDYLAHAQQLYDWLIRPLSQRLASLKIQTLVTVPDQTLRTVPIAALHDGKQFLIEKMAIASSPGLELTDPEVSSNQPRLILAGLTQSVQGYPALIHVQEEMDAIQSLYGGNMLVDDSFQTAAMKVALGKQHYQVAHIASHGEFGKRVEDSFLLTYDSRVKVNDLASAIGIGRFTDQPLELLTLSACYTAAGDDRAALGLAGITVKAGARSALASLWPINDRATAKLMTTFYRQWQKPNTGKAAALRQAQLEMLSDVRYRHPGYWSPFLMIGNWR